MRLVSGPITTFAAAALISLVATAYAPPAQADDAVGTMAGIVLSLQHFPSDADKATLTAIAEGEASDSVKAVASAIAGMQHKVSDADKAKLMAIAADENEPANLRELAGIVAGVNHVPSDEAKAALAALIEE